MQLKAVGYELDYFTFPGVGISAALPSLGIVTRELS